jgi:hypothetical protein
MDRLGPEIVNGANIEKTSQEDTCMHACAFWCDSTVQWASFVILLMNNDTILPHTRPHCLPVEDSAVVHIDIFPLSPFISTFVRIIYATDILK